MIFRDKSMNNKIKISSLLLSIMMALFLVGCNSSSSEEIVEETVNQEPATTKEPATTNESKAEQQQETELELNIEIPIGGNSWILGKVNESSSLINDAGISNWKNAEDELVTYFYVSKVGEINLGVKGSVASGYADLMVKLNDQNKAIQVNNISESVTPIGTFLVDEIGYQKVIIKGQSTTSGEFPTLSHLLIGGAAANGNNFYVKDDFYWGRRGPSVHLRYNTPNSGDDYEWFYSEIEVPQGSDTLGSYFMTNGFGEGYMGIQVNSSSERRVLFSVWSPFHTDDPSTIPEEDRIELLAKGQGVTTGQFGNEGSGGQSYYVYDWKPATTYKLLVNIKPSEEVGKSDYSGYFYSPETNEWKLIASFRRPKTTTYVTNQHSFLENFIPSAGQFERKGLYKNQWLRNTSGQWHGVSEATFTYDATAEKEARLDYQGGVEDGVFYMKNTGFFSESTAKYTKFSVSPGSEPELDLSKLPVGSNDTENIPVNSVLLDNTTFSVSSSSEQAGHEIHLAFDGDLSTIWHTAWGENEPDYPHEVVIDLGTNYKVNRFDYSPRQGGGNGTITEYKLYVSPTISDFGDEVATGSWQNDGSVKSITYAAVTGRYVKLVATSGNGVWASAAEFQVGVNNTTMLDTSDLVVSSTSLAELVAEQTPLSQAFDGDINTIWHTSYLDHSVVYPHEIIIDLTESKNITQFNYTPRQDGGINGTISEYEIYINESLTDFGQPAAIGTWAATQDVKMVVIPKTTGRYIKFVAVSEVGGNSWASAAEFNIGVSE